FVGVNGSIHVLLIPNSRLSRKVAKNPKMRLLLSIAATGLLFHHISCDWVDHRIETHACEKSPQELTQPHRSRPEHSHVVDGRLRVLPGARLPPPAGF